MIAFQPVYSRARYMGQAAPATPAAPPAAPAAAPAAPIAPIVTTTSYTGVPGFLETVAVLGVSAAAAWTGVRAGMNKTNPKLQRAAGWVGGVGSAIVGLLYLGTKTGVTRTIALPQIQVSPA
jgi:hypothetical protein